MSNPRATTRSQSDADPSLLAAPATFRRRRSPSRNQRLLSPHNIEEEVDSVFNFPEPPTVMATPEQLQAIRDELRAEVRRELRTETAAAAAGTPDAIRRKPEIPTFDKEHIEIWIRRTEHSYTRAGISAVSDKFAWLETKFPVATDPKIDEFLYGDATDPNWTAFLAYLRKEYGSTKQQRASIFLDGFKRDGRRPSQYVATLNDKTKDVTTDDIKKEMLIREMPVEIRRMLQERVENLNFQETAEIADAHFDKDGRPLHSNTQTSVNEVSSAEFSTPFPEDNGVNAVRQTPQNRKNFQSQQTRGNTRTQKGWHARTAENSNAPQNKANTKTSGLCYYHETFGDEAKKCDVGCKRFDEKRFSGNAKAGRR